MLHLACSQDPAQTSNNPSLGHGEQRIRGVHHPHPAGMGGSLHGHPMGHPDRVRRAHPHRGQVREGLGDGQQPLRQGRGLPGQLGQVRQRQRMGQGEGAAVGTPQRFQVGPAAQRPADAGPLPASS